MRAVALVVIVVGLASAIDVRSAAARADGQTGVTPSAQPLRSGVDLVEIAALVRDQDGRLVTDLTAADFQVIENGTPQMIAAFQRVSMPVRSIGGGAAPLSSDVASNERATDARIFILVLDALHVAPVRTRVVRDYARQFIERHAGPADLVAVVSPGGLAAATQDFTSDKARLLAAVGQFAGSKLLSASVEIEQEANGLRAPMHQGMDPSDGERTNRVRALASVLDALAGHLARVENRRKSLLLFSEGIDYDMLDVTGKLQRYSSEVMKALDEAIGALMRSNVSMYPIDPRALSSAEGDLVENPVFRPTPSVTQSSVEAEYSGSVRGLRHMAESTGGFAAVDRNDIGPAFERIIEESSDYYILGYTPSKRATPGEPRTIDVRVSRPGTRVVARKGYVAPVAPARGFSSPTAIEEAPFTPNTPVLARNNRIDIPAPETSVRPPPGVPAELSRLLASPLPRTGLPLRVQAVAFKGSNRKAAVRLVVEVLGRSLAFAERSGRFEEHIELALLTVDDRARASNGTSARLDVRVTTDELQRVKATGVRWLTQLDLVPGHYQVRVAGRALGTATSGSIAWDIDVPVFESDRLTMSGVTLTSLPSVLMFTRGDPWLQSTLETPPSAARSFIVGDQIKAGVEVYVPALAPADVYIASEIEWPDGSRHAGVRQRVARGNGRPRAEAIGFPVDTANLPAGRYVLHVVLNPSDGASKVERSVPFEVVRRN